MPPTPAAAVPTLRDPTSRVLAMGILLGAAAIILIGALLHAHVPGGADAQMQRIADDPRWVDVHAMLTLGQLLAIPGILLLAMQWRSGRDAPLLAGVALAVMGFLLGALATLLSATALRGAAAAGDATLFAVIDATLLPMGWLCVLLVAGGATLLGTHLLAEPAIGTRGTAWLLLAGGVLALAAAVAIPPGHPWLHPYVLRYGAVLLAAILALVAARIPREAPSPERRATRRHVP